MHPMKISYVLFLLATSLAGLTACGSSGALPEFVSGTYSLTVNVDHDTCSRHVLSGPLEDQVNGRGDFINIFFPGVEAGAAEVRVSAHRIVEGTYTWSAYQPVGDSCPTAIAYSQVYAKWRSDGTIDATLLNSWSGLACSQLPASYPQKIDCESASHLTYTLKQ